MSELTDPIPNLVDKHHYFNQCLNYYDRPELSNINSNLATPLVLIHGWLGSWKSWSLVLDNLQTSRRLIAISLRGFGDSTKDAQNSIENHAYDVINLLDYLQINQCIVGGHCIGAIISAVIASKRPTLVVGLMMCNGTLKAKPNHVYDKINGSTMNDLRHTVVTLFSNSINHEDSEASKLFLQTFQLQDIQHSVDQNLWNNFISVIIQERLKSSPVSCQNMLNSLIDDDHNRDMTLIKVPVLIIRGENDVFFDVNEQNRLKEALDNAISISFITVGEAGHSAIWTHAKEVAELMDDWLDCE